MGLEPVNYNHFQQETWHIPWGKSSNIQPVGGSETPSGDKTVLGRWQTRARLQSSCICLLINLPKWYGCGIKQTLRPQVSRNESESEVAQSCPTLCDHMDCSLQGSSIHGIFQPRILEWVAISFSRRPS